MICEKIMINLPQRAEISCLRFGGTPSKGNILLLNGSAFNKGQWDLLLKIRTDKGGLLDYNVFSFDYPGTGESSTTTPDWDIWRITDDVALLIEKLKLNRPHLYGVSKGTMVAQTMAIRYPHLISSIAGYGWYNYSYSRIHVVRRFFENRLSEFRKIMGDWSKPLDAYFIESLWQRVYKPLIMGKEAHTIIKKIYNFVIGLILKSRLKKLLYKSSMWNIYSWFNYAIGPMQLEINLISSSLQQSTIPILIQHGQGDETLPFSMAQELSQQLPCAQFLQYPKEYTHLSPMMNMEHAKAIVKDYLHFLT